MRARRLFAVVVGMSLAASLAGVARAQDFFPWDTRHYEFVPRLSTLVRTGGFGGFHDRYFVRGEYDFSVAPSPLAIFPPIYNGDFSNVEAAGVHPIKDEVIDLDDAFNLSGLTGSTRYRGPRNVFRFNGTTDDGSRVNLWAAQIGPWMLMRGATKPPEGSADFFEYSIRAVARTRPSADLNGDGKVDVDDLRLWQERPDRLGGDFVEWQRQLGEQPPIAEMDAEIDAAVAAAGASLSAIPEPGSMVLAALAGVALVSARRRVVSRVARA